jgi:hypothetical protein
MDEMVTQLRHDAELLCERFDRGALPQAAIDQLKLAVDLVRKVQSREYADDRATLEALTACLWIVGVIAADYKH